MAWDKQLWRIQQSGKFIIFVVYLSFFLDNMLLTVVVPIVPDMLYKLDYSGDALNNNYLHNFGKVRNCSGHSTEAEEAPTSRQHMVNENSEVGLLFASKAIVQLIMNPIIGPLTNRMGCSAPLFAGTLILILSSLMFAHGKTFAVLFAARSVQGVGSACISVAGMAMIADRYPDDKERSKIMGITMGGIAAGVLRYPFGSVIYDFVGKTPPLLTVAALLFIDSALLLIFLRPHLEPERLLVGTSILKLMKDPYINVATGAICISTFAIAVLEPCLPLWLMESMDPPRWQLGTVFIPDSLGYLLGTNLFGFVTYKLGRWLTAMISMVVVGICALVIPYSSHILQLVIPHFGLGLGIGVVDASLMPLLAYLVDSRYVALYGSVYAIAQVAVCLAYSIGPLLGGYMVKRLGFPWVMRAIGIANLLYSPLCYFLKDTAALEENMVINLKSTDYLANKVAPKAEGRTAYSSFSNED
ncbi:synaptic vesicular amine transporter-like isoform X2 [Stegodyphus dumicola]|uniref:synaptic vesicular amine transporter-like isoform X2 n=1 Tax=Stegodyphus dumicola TaxID=202533 RepID=UPI0015AF47C1|nr:synaptic vesicular amine transporter-like isoform X2 [Stegodyphus dumicola]